MSSKRPRRIAIAGSSGSTGKTSEAVALACHLAERGSTVRVWDMDGQGDTSTYFNLETPLYTVAEVLAKERIFPDPSSSDGVRAPLFRDIEVPILRNSDEEVDQYGGYNPETEAAASWMKNITVIPSGLGPTGTQLDEVLVSLQMKSIEQEKFLRAIASMDEGREPPDYEIYDLHGTVSLLTYLVLRLVDKVLTVVVPDDKTTGRNLTKLVDIIADVSEINDGLKLDGIIPVRIKPERDGRFYVDIVEALQQNPSYKGRVTPMVSEAVVFPQSYQAREPLLYFVPGHRGTKQHRKILEWLDKHKVTA